MSNPYSPLHTPRARPALAAPAQGSARSEFDGSSNIHPLSFVRETSWMPCATPTTNSYGSNIPMGYDPGWNSVDNNRTDAQIYSNQYNMPPPQTLNNNAFPAIVHPASLPTPLTSHMGPLDSFASLEKELFVADRWNHLPTAPTQIAEPGTILCNDDYSLSALQYDYLMMLGENEETKRSLDLMSQTLPQPTSTAEISSKKLFSDSSDTSIQGFGAGGPYARPFPVAHQYLNVTSRNPPSLDKMSALDSPVSALGSSLSRNTSGSSLSPGSPSPSSPGNNRSPEGSPQPLQHHDQARSLFPLVPVSASHSNSNNGLGDSNHNSPAPGPSTRRRAAAARESQQMQSPPRDSIPQPTQYGATGPPHLPHTLPPAPAIGNYDPQQNSGPGQQQRLHFFIHSPAPGGPDFPGNQIQPSVSATSSTSIITFPPPATEERSRSNPTGHRRHITSQALLPVQAPTQPRQYRTPSATSRKEIPAFVHTFAKRTREEAGISGEEDDPGRISQDRSTPRKSEERQLVWPVAEEEPLDLEDAIARKRRKNTEAARRTRHRKLDHVRNLEESLERLKEEKEEWVRRALDAEDKLGELERRFMNRANGSPGDG